MERSSLWAEPYVASKYGLVGFSRSPRLSFQEMGSAVSASAVCPGFIDNAGIYEQWKMQYGVEAPWLVGSVRVQEVAEAVLRAIEYDLPEVIVTPGAPRFVMALNAMVPGLLEEVATKLGVSEVAHALAEHRANKRTDKNDCK